MMPSQSERLHVVDHSSELGRWSEGFWTPHPSLAGLVDAMWCGEGSTSYAFDRILPLGSSYLLINLGPTQVVTDSRGRAREFRSTQLSGPQTAFLDVRSPDGVEMMGVAFTPSGARRMLGVGLHRIAHQLVDLTDVLGDAVRSLRERLLEAKSDTERCRRLEQWLLARLGKGRPGHPVAEWALEKVVKSAGAVRISDLARDSGFSRKHLAELFRHNVGLTPKRLARLHRFHDTLDRARTRTEVDWSELALDCGYYDQSHLSRDFRDFSGLSPERLLSSRVVDPFTLALG